MIIITYWKITAQNAMVLIFIFQALSTSATNENLMQLLKNDFATNRVAESLLMIDFAASFNVYMLLTLLGLGLIIAVWLLNKQQKQQKQLELKIQSYSNIIQQKDEKLQSLDTAKNHFYTNMTHELRTPLSLILGPAKQIISEGLPTSSINKNMNHIVKNTEYVLDMVNQMLDIAKIEGEQMKIEVIQGDIIAYTQEILDQFQAIFTQKEQKVNLITSEESWTTNFDKDKYRKIILNLLSNAAKFTPKGQALQLCLMKYVENGKDFIRLDVKDTGLGIEQQQLNQVFNRFYQTPNTSSEMEGTGIGLTLVKELVELQGGKILVNSKINKGTSFEVYLPVLDSAPLALSQKKEEDATESVVLTNKNVVLERDEKMINLLIVEDNLEMQEYISSLLDATKFKIFRANDGEEGLYKAKEVMPDLVISDLMMPKKDGFNLIQALRKNHHTMHLPVLIVSAKASHEYRLKGLQYGADAYLAKPFDPKEFQLQINRLTQARYARIQNNMAISMHQDQQPIEDLFVTDLRKYIIDNISKTDLNGNSIGQHFALSRVHLYRKLKVANGQSISKFVKNIRLEKAMELLKKGELNISEITWQTGFASISHFSRSFKKVYGKTASEVLMENKTRPVN